jgi:glycosyltransferase involved in cell wall biosynthesis
VYLPDWFIKLASKTIIKNANSAIAQSNDMKRVMQAIYPREIAVVPMGIELEEYKDRCSEKGRETPQKRIIFVGRFDPVKGLDNLLRAMNSVGKVLPDAQLILVGDGKERKNLESLADSLGIRDSVDFAGRLNGEKKTEYLCQADLFVLPSISEGFGIVILEAMACGLPVVATRVGGVPDLVEDGVNGYLVESRDFQEMAKKIILLLQNPTLHHQIATNNRKKVQGYAWENIISQLERIYLEIS